MQILELVKNTCKKWQRKERALLGRTVNVELPKCFMAFFLHEQAVSSVKWLLTHPKGRKHWAT